MEPCCVSPTSAQQKGASSLPHVRTQHRVNFPMVNPNSWQGWFYIKKQIANVKLYILQQIDTRIKSKSDKYFGNPIKRQLLENGEPLRNLPKAAHTAWSIPQVTILSQGHGPARSDMPHQTNNSEQSVVWPASGILRWVWRVLVAWERSLQAWQRCELHTVQYRAATWLSSSSQATMPHTLPPPCKLWHNTLSVVAQHPVSCGTRPHMLWHNTPKLWHNTP